MTGFEKIFGLIKKEEKRAGSDYTATVTRVENGIAYVQITGAEITDTPVTMSIDAKPGDIVRVRVNHGKAWITGNDTRPPTSDAGTVQRIQANTSGLEKRIRKIEREAITQGDFISHSIGASAINTAFTNTGHQLYVKISRFKNIVTMTGEIVTGSALNASAFIAMFSLPAEYRPFSQIFFTAYKEGGTATTTFYMDSVDSLWVRLLSNGGVQASTTYRFTVSYTAAYGG